ncbi:MAG: hypothetical protein JWN30_141 [Bacilli bacterium]|nr:hypothetical protein [Bacilli bacterium]
MLASLPKRGIQYLISILMEIYNLSMVAYNHNENLLTFTYLMAQPISDDQLSPFKKSIFNHLNVLGMLNQEFLVEDPVVIESRVLSYYDQTSQVSVLTYSVPVMSFHIQALRIISKLVDQELQPGIVRSSSEALDYVSLLADDIINQGIRAENAFPSSSPSKVYREGTRIFVAY